MKYLIKIDGAYELTAKIEGTGSGCGAGPPWLKPPWIFRKDPTDGPPGKILQQTLENESGRTMSP